jgi:hypothetical protein
VVHLLCSDVAMICFQAAAVLPRSWFVVQRWRKRHGGISRVVAMAIESGLDVPVSVEGKGGCACVRAGARAGDRDHGGDFLHPT